ncbi:MAG TPA: leishmanolysin-related zinc metalloendopeptidase, partial [Gemmatimonadaceae bacterium]|nr:leishmanolysin-related zinc metalloendopeptidase [Gemmatimonadaceae bacterium]
VAGGVTTGNPTTSASAVARDALNNVVAATPVWSSSNARVARVAADGTVQAIGSGSSTITATFGSVTANATLNVTAAASGFTVHVRMVTSVTPSVQTAFDNAATRWAQIIRGHLPDVSVNNLDVSACAGQSAGTTVLTEVLQDVVIYANIAPIDGVGSILGQAGPCFIRGGGGLPVIGMMKFDSDDLANMEANGILVPVILHEMGHVLGIGTMWGSLLEDAMPSASQDPIFTGANAIWAMNNLGTGYAGRPAPVENCVGRANCGSGTINSHWREGILARELMTGFVTSSGGLNPLSPLTAASLIDIGYVVDVAQSDPQPWFLRLGPVTEEPLIEIREGSPPVPRAVDAAGRILPSPVIRR